MNSNLHLYDASEENNLLQSAKFEWVFFVRLLDFLVYHMKDTKSEWLCNMSTSSLEWYIHELKPLQMDSAVIWPFFVLLSYHSYEFVTFELSFIRYLKNIAMTCNA